jgi:hypothetical protein
MSMFCRSLFVLFLLAIVLSVLRPLQIMITTLLSSNSSCSDMHFEYNILHNKMDADKSMEKEAMCVQCLAPGTFDVHTKKLITNVDYLVTWRQSITNT